MHSLPDGFTIERFADRTEVHYRGENVLSRGGCKMKYLEVRDRATFIPVVAFVPHEVLFGAASQFALSEPWRVRSVEYGIGRVGFPTTRVERPGVDPVVVVRLDNVAAESDSEGWQSSARTMREAHRFIEENYDDLRTGDVVDVEFALGETTKKKTPEALDFPCNERGAPTKVFRYAPKYRPAGYATVPDGYRIVERGTGGHYPKRIDLPEGKTVFGVVEYDRKLSEKEVADYELTEIAPF